MKQKTPVFRDITPLLEQEYGKELSARVLADAQARYSALCADHAQDSKAVQTHTFGKIYPCIALYEALQAQGVAQKDALAFLDRSFSAMAEPDAESIRRMLKVPGLYRLMPRIFRWVTVHQFGEQAGFRAKFYSTGSDRCKFDMTHCLYCDVCRAYGYPELIPCFCHTDDVTDGHMHPNLVWNRTKIMGDGADCCDFDLFIRK